MRFAHLADTHLGYRQYNLDEREEDFYSAFHAAIDRIIESKCDFVLHSGDLFDSPRPHVRAMVEVREALDKLHENEIPFFAIPGNHDTLMRRGAIVPHAIYRRIELLTAEEPWREFNGVFIGGMPYRSKIHAEEMRDELKKLAKKAKNYERKILLLHQGIDKYIPVEYELKLADIPTGFDYYAMGHIHKRIANGRFAYPGSTEIWRADELDDYEKNGKGFYLVDVENFGIKRVDIQARKFIRAEIASESDIEMVKKNIGGEMPVVNLTVAADVHEYSRIYGKIMRELRGALYLDVRRRRAEDKALPAETIDIRSLIDGAMEGYTTPEKEYAHLLFKALSIGNMDEARTLTVDFYDKFTCTKPKTGRSWGDAAEDVGQSSLEAFR